MKTLKRHSKLFALTISFLVLIQSCKVYHSDSVSLNQASQEFKPAKIQTSNNEILKFRGIKNEGNFYYGVKKVKGEILNIPIDEKSIKSVKLENETMSTILTIALPVVIIVTGLAIIAASLNDLGNLGGNWDFGY